MTTAPAAVLDAMTDAIQAASSRNHGIVCAADLAQAAWDGLVGVCEVREEWGVCDRDGEQVFLYRADEARADREVEDGLPGDHKVHRVVITVPTEEQP